MSAIRIGLDGYNLALARGTGVATYGRTLAHAVVRAGYKLDLVYGLGVPQDSREDLRETLFYARLAEDAPAQLPTNLSARVKRAAMLPGTRDLIAVPHSGHVVAPDLELRVPPFDRLFTRGSLFTICARYFRRFGRFMPLRIPTPPEIMHWTYPLPLRMLGSRNIYTLHDLVPLRLPHTTLEDKRYYDRLIRTCLAEAAHIVSVSEASRSDIEMLFPGYGDKITNTYQPIDLAIDPRTDDLQRIRKLFDLDAGNYFLFFGAIEPKKNVGRLIEAYLSADIETPLIIVGAEAWRSDHELRLLHGAHGSVLSGTRSIRRIDYLPRHLLIELVAGAKAVAFPSLYEGFGLPAAEACALGIPVLASSGGSLPEVVGPGGLIVDPYDVSAMAAALRRLDEDSLLRETLGAAGKRHTTKFSFDRYTTVITSLYQHVIESCDLAR